LHIEVQVYDTEHFFTTRNTLRDMFPSGRNYLMETFYRNMRRNHNILMQEGKPLGGFWNYDKENRKKLPRNMVLPEPYAPANDVSDILNELSLAGVKAIGYIRGNHFQWPVSRQQALDALEHFCTHCLPHFGTYQDAMTMKSETAFHSLLSFALNIKLLSPHEVIGRVIREANQHSQEISLSQTKGFVRQILGWREFMRGVYWARMPAYSGLNYFQHHRKLPQWYWTGNTKMNCLKHDIQQSLQHAYAHHIQRLMLTGNFALLPGINPDEVDAWYLGIYIDAIEWVEITNTRGMSQFADGGLLATKPYVSSANYIEKMSDYCSTCYYKAKQKTGECACPFNSLYWHFFKRHRNLLQHNPRIAMMYKVWDAMPHDSQDAYMAQAEHYLQNIEYL
jgi:deoxyribodipyrimidine photolyase-related protein